VSDTKDTTALATTAHHSAGLAPMSFDALVSMGDKLVRTGFLPEHIKTGAQAAAIIMTGREMGMEPMRALRSLAMVKGKVTEYADSQLARFKSDGGKARWVKLDDAEAVLWLRHPNGDEHTETFTLRDAQRAGAGPMYQKHPKAMLRSRAVTAGLKSLGWEGGCGTYDPAELAEAPAPRTVVQAEPEMDVASALVEAFAAATTRHQWDEACLAVESANLSEDERVVIRESAARAKKRIKAAMEAVEARAVSAAADEMPPVGDDDDGGVL